MKNLGYISLITITFLIWIGDHTKMQKELFNQKYCNEKLSNYCVYYDSLLEKLIADDTVRLNLKRKYKSYKK